jgi:cytochrome c oxidase subunit II
MGFWPFRRAGSAAQRPGCDKVKLARNWFSHKHLLIGGTLAVAALLMGCFPQDRMSTFGTAGPVAEKQLLLFNALLWVMVAVFVLVEGALVYAAIRFRRRPGQGLPNQVHGNTPLEVTWTIIPTILILALGVWSVITLFELEQPPASAAGDALAIDVVGHQWWWGFEYQDADGNGKRISTANELRVPVGRAITVTLRSNDVIHSFWIPKLAGKMDVVPTRNNRMWFLAEETGTYYGQCAEFCGIAHALMKFRVVVLPEDEYQDWVASYGQPHQQLFPEAQRGQQIFNGKGGCIVCHTATGPDTPEVVQGRVQGFLSGAPIAPGPNLTDLATRETFAAGLVELNRENLRQWVTNPDSIKPGNRMAQLAAIYQTPSGNTSLSPDEVSGLIEYLLTLQ